MRALTIVAAVAMATLARAEPASGTTGQTLDLPLEDARTNPNWRVKPSGSQVDRAFPEFARMLRLSGHALLHCRAEPSGTVDECRIVNETPTGLGFGAAAESLAPFFQMRPATIDGRPVKADIDVPINFKWNAGDGSRPEPLGPPESVDPSSLALARDVLSLEGSEDALRRSWRRWLDGLVDTAIATGETRPSVEVIDAFQQSINGTVAEVIDRDAHILAAQVPPDQLRSIREFLVTAPGRSLVTFFASDKLRRSGEDTSQRLSWTARDLFCAKIACMGSPEK